MLQSLCIALLAGVAVSQITTTTTQRSLRRVPEIDFNNEGCGGKETNIVVFRMPQLGFVKRCQQLNRGDCISYSEAKLRCPCICRNRLRFKNPAGVLRDDYKATTQRPELKARTALNFSDNIYFNWPQEPSNDLANLLSSFTGRRRRRATRMRRSARRLAIF